MSGIGSRLIALDGSAGAAGRIPAEPPIDGPLWSVVVPALLFAVAFLATYRLYRHFAGKR